MGYYTLTLSCGHTEKRQVLFNKASQRDSKIEWMERSLKCSDCSRKAYAAQKDQERILQAVTTATGKVVKSVEVWVSVLFVRFESGSPKFVSKKVLDVSSEMPDLDGSDKQVAWAETIRKNTISKLAHRPDLLKFISQRPSARWWIDNRTQGETSSGYYNMITESHLDSMIDNIRRTA